MIGKKRYVVEVLPSIVDADSWARGCIGEKFIVEYYERGASYYAVVKDGEPTNRLLPRRHVKQLPITEIYIDTAPIEDFMANTLIQGGM